MPSESCLWEVKLNDNELRMPVSYERESLIERLFVAREYPIRLAETKSLFAQDLK